MKTINKSIAIGAAFTAAVILVPAAAHAGPPPPPRPSNGIQLAADIVNLVRAVIEPRPAPVVVAPPAERTVTTKVVTSTPVVTTTPVVVETVPAETAPVVVETVPVVTTTPATTIVTGATKVTEVTEVVTVPEFTYTYFYGQYVPYYDGWYFYANDWIWGGIGPRPARPRWTPPPRPRTIVVTPRPQPHGPEHGRPAPGRATVVRPEGRGGNPPPKGGGRQPAARPSGGGKTGGGIPVAPSQHRIPRKGR